MRDESVISTELMAAREASGLSRERVAAALGVSAKSVERWELTGKVKKAQLAEIQAFYRDLAVGKIRLGADGIPQVAAAQLPQDLSEIASRFDREMARLGAEDEELDYMKAALHSAATAKFVTQTPDGSARSPSASEAEFRLVLEGMKHWLRLRMQWRGAQPFTLAETDGVQVAPDERPRKVAESAPDAPYSPKRERVDPDAKKGRRRA